MNPITRRAAYVEDKGLRESRTRSGLVIREDGGKLIFDGYASVTNVPYTVTDWLGDYTETIARGAFKKALAERDDVRLLVNHDGIPLARTASGTLDLSEDDTGLHCVAELDPSSPLVQMVRSAMDRNDLDQMSFAFRATRQEWNEDYTERSILEVRLFDTSVVTYPVSLTMSAKLCAAEPDAEPRELVVPDVPPAEPALIVPTDDETNRRRLALAKARLNLR